MNVLYRTFIGKGISPGRHGQGGPAVMIYQNNHDATYDIAERIASALRSTEFGSWRACVIKNASGQSASQYVEISWEDEDCDNQTEPFCIRVSDHEARSYNRCGNFSITFAIDQDSHFTLDPRVLNEMVETTHEVLDCDDDGNDIVFEVTEAEEEYRGLEINDERIGAAIDAAVAAARRFFESEIA